MDIGLALPQYDFSVPGERPLAWSTVLAIADRAVELGFTSLWLSDHLFLSLENYGGSGERYDSFEPISALGALAARYPEVTVGTLVFCVQFRAPRLLAKQLQTLDALAPGRVVAGLGAGWYRPEFDALGIPFEEPRVRMRQLTDATREIRSFLGDRDVPLWYGGKGDYVVRLAARHADGWNTVWAWQPDAYKAKLDIVERELAAQGRDPSTFMLSLGLTTLIAENDADLQRRWDHWRSVAPDRMLDQFDFDDWRSGRLIGTVEQVREQVSAWRTLGVRLLVVNLGALPFSLTDPDDLDLVASALL